MQPLALIFFVLFAVTQLVMYIAIRRRIASSTMVSAGGVLASVVFMTLFGLAQNNIFVHALVVGVLVGGAVSVANLVIAYYFQGNELRSASPQQEEWSVTE